MTRSRGAEAVAVVQRDSLDAAGKDTEPRYNPG